MATQLTINKWLSYNKMIDFLRKCTAQGEKLIVGGDFNEERKGKSSSLSGQAIIDYMFISPELVPALQQYGYNHFDQVLAMDHR
eukprot:11741306-Ditylum_brightwellii.AAC.1